MDLDIYIPSYKRPQAPLIKKLKDAGLEFTIVLDHQDDLKDYASLKSEKVKIMFVEPPQGIGYVRQKIKERYCGRPIIMLDDDTQLRLRDFNEPTHLPVVKTSEQVVEWFNIVDDFCKKNNFDIGSVSDSAFSWDDTMHTIKEAPCCSVTIFNSERVHEINYDPLLYKRMEDWDLILQGITKHFSFLTCNDVLRHCPMNKQGKDQGGCTEVYQNKSIMFRTTSYLMQKWGKDIVRLRKNKTIGECWDFKVDLRRMRKIYGYTY